MGSRAPPAAERAPVGGIRRPSAPGAVLGRAARRAGLLFLVGPVFGLLGSRPVVDVLGRHHHAGVARSALRLSLGASLGAVAVVVALGLPLAWVLARVEFPGPAGLPGRWWCCPWSCHRWWVAWPSWPRWVVNRSWAVWLWDTFGIQLTFSGVGVVLAEAFVAMPFFVLTVEAALRSGGRAHEELAATLGAGPWTVLWRVTLPGVAPVDRRGSRAGMGPGAG